MADAINRNIDLQYLWETSPDLSEFGDGLIGFVWEPYDWYVTLREIYQQPKNTWVYLGLVGLLPGISGGLLAKVGGKQDEAEDIARGFLKENGGNSSNIPLGGRGPISGRPFDESNAGGPIRNLTTNRIKITSRGIDYLEQHIPRFGDDAANSAMVDRLRKISRGELQHTQYDLYFYSHELRESVRYRRLGHPTDAGNDHVLWENAHTATLEDYRIPDFDANRNSLLYHPDIWHLFD